MVARKNQHIVGVIALDKANVLVDGICRALVPLGVFALGIGRQHLHAAVRGVEAPRLAVADVLVQLQRLILGQNADGVNLGVDTVRQREIDNPVFAAKGDRGLCRVLRQNHQPASLTARQQHGDTTLLLKLHNLVPPVPLRFRLGSGAVISVEAHAHRRHAEQSALHLSV